MMDAHRIFVEKNPEFRVEAESLRNEFNENLSLSLRSLRLLNVYDLFGFSDGLLEKCRYTVFGETVTDTVSDEPETSGDAKKITVFDNKGTMSLSVSLSNLYFIESDDNYIKVWYTDSSSMLRSYFLRCRMKTVEESFKGSSLMRCHRKYIVNIDKVRALSRGVGGGYSLLLDIADIPPVPVSKTYEQSILESCGK